MDDLPKDRRRAFWTVAAVCLLGAYALGFGPCICVAYLFDDPDWMNDVIEAAYTPLFAALGYCPVLKDAHSAFYGWWLSQIPDGVLYALFILLAPGLAGAGLWLTVRVVNRRERWAMWTLAVVLGLPALYVASLGPACWWKGYGSSSWPGQAGQGADEVYAPRIYWPIGRLVMHSPKPVAKAVGWYAMSNGRAVKIAVEPRGNHYYSLQ